VDVLKTLLGEGADPNATNMYGWTALHSAAVEGGVEACEALADEKADKRATNLVRVNTCE
jgi:ankyrin repeat protein